MMDTLHVLYVRSLTIGGVLIRASSWWDQWSHCGLLTDEGTVIHAKAFHGVVEEPVEVMLPRYTAFERVAIKVPAPELGIQWAREQLGSGYDYGSIADFVLRTELAHETKFQCVELVESSLAVAGNHRFRRPLHRVTVAQSFMVR